MTDNNLPIVDAGMAAKATVGSVFVTWLGALFSVETIVYLSFLFGVVAGVFSVVRHFQEERRARAKEQREIELHAARMAALAAGDPATTAADTGCGGLV